jgi:hypothetical protein
MWANYCPSNRGVAIKTTFTKLKLQCDRFGYQKAFIGFVTYIKDRSTYFITPGNNFYAFMHKDWEFRPEQECRMVRNGAPEDDDLELPIDLIEVIDEIVVHRLATQEYYDEVKKLLEHNAAELVSKLRWSSLRGSSNLARGSSAQRNLRFYHMRSFGK